LPGVFSYPLVFANLNEIVHEFEKNQHQISNKLTGRTIKTFSTQQIYFSLDSIPSKCLSAHQLF